MRREKDLNEVVQTTTVFANVSKGVLAKHEDIQAVFGTTDEERVCRRILQDGDLQVRLSLHLRAGMELLSLSRYSQQATAAERQLL